MGRADTDALYQALVRARFSFLPRGRLHLGRVIYPAVTAHFPKLCDDTYRCCDNCSSNVKAPEWQHQVRGALDWLKEDPSSGVTKDAARNWWRFS